MRTALAAMVVLGLMLGTAGCHVLDFTPRFAPGDIAIFDNLFSVSVADERNAVAVGYQGAVYWTADGGETWRKGSTDTLSSLYSVSMADALHGWAVGQHGTIVHTDDGGNTWKQQANLKHDEGSHLFGIHAIDSKTAWAVGEWGSRILTRDGGRTWQDHSLTITFEHPQFVWLETREQKRVRDGEKVYEDVGLNNVYCLPDRPEKCWIVGEFGYIFNSDDMGMTWTRSSIEGNVRINPIIFEHNAIAIGEEDRWMLGEFSDRVENETHLNILIEPYVSPGEIAAFGSADDPYQLFDILSARIGEARAVLEDAGVLSDRFRIPNKPPWDYEDFLEDDPTFLERYIEGRKADQPMVHVGVIQNPYLYTIRFRDESNGMIAGLGGVVLISSDGGLSWNYRIMDRKQALFSVATLNERSIAVGEKGFFRVSDDDGETWMNASESFPRIFTFMRDIDFERENRLGMIVGQEGMVLRSVDSGASWTRVLPPDDRRKS